MPSGASQNRTLRNFETNCSAQVPNFFPAELTASLNQLGLSFEVLVEVFVGLGIFTTHNFWSDDSVRISFGVY